MGFSPSPHPSPTLVSFKNKSRAPSTVSTQLHPLHQRAAEGKSTLHPECHLEVLFQRSQEAHLSQQKLLYNILGISFSPA